MAPLDAEQFNAISVHKAESSQLPPHARGKRFNRYFDILPAAHSRVVLNIINNDHETDYINANYVKGLGTDHRSYIAAQGPTQNTLKDFVRMLWEQDVCVIVMLTKLREGPKAKCEPYFPSRLDTPLQFGEFVVSLDSSNSDKCYILNQLRVKHRGAEKVVSQYWYTTWPDHGVPLQPSGEMFTDDMLTLIHDVRKNRKVVKLPIYTLPSAGRRDRC